MRTFGFVFARGGSKGVPRKNLAEVGGVPLIERSIRIGLATPGIDRMIVNTDDEEIATVARSAGADVPFLRPPELAADTSSEIEAWRHAIQTLRDGGEGFDRIVSLPATCPLREVADVTACIKRFEQGDADFVMTITEASANPYFNMVTVAEDGAVALAISSAVRPLNRQQAPAVYELTPVAAVTSPDYVMSGVDIFSGRFRAVVVDPLRAVDIDTPRDLAFARFLADTKTA